MALPAGAAGFHEALVIWQKCQRRGFLFLGLMGFLKAFKKISLADSFIFAGLCLLGTGLWWLRPWVSLTVTGGLLFFVGFRASIGDKQ